MLDVQKYPPPRGSAAMFLIFPDLFAVLGPGRCLKSFLEAVRFISTHREPVSSRGDPIRDQNYASQTRAVLECRKLPCMNQSPFRVDSCAEFLYRHS